MNTHTNHIHGFLINVICIVFNDHSIMSYTLLHTRTIQLIINSVIPDQMKTTEWTSIIISHIYILFLWHGKAFFQNKYIGLYLHIFLMSYKYQIINKFLIHCQNQLFAIIYVNHPIIEVPLSMPTFCLYNAFLSFLLKAKIGGHAWYLIVFS